MYNRYLAAAAGDAPSSPPPPHPAGEAAAPGHGLSGRLPNLRLDMDTVIVLAIVWFLLSGDEEKDGIDWEQLFLIGVLLLLGV